VKAVNASLAIINGGRDVVRDIILTFTVNPKCPSEKNDM
jgi:hypothetical protein